MFKKSIIAILIIGLVIILGFIACSKDKEDNPVTRWGDKHNSMTGQGHAF